MAVFSVIMLHSECQNLVLWLRSVILCQQIFRMSYPGYALFVSNSLQLQRCGSDVKPFEQPGQSLSIRGSGPKWWQPVDTSPGCYFSTSQLFTQLEMSLRRLWQAATFLCLSPSVFSLCLSSFFFHLIHLSLFLPASLPLPVSLLLSCEHIMRKTVSRSPVNRLTFAFGYCSNLLALKYLNIQNPTLHLRHGQIPPATISHLCAYDHVVCIH